MTVEELLKPRYKVIADFPRNCAHIGRVFEPGEIGVETQIKWEQYPHLFKRLEWWEERKEEDMPEYVKDEDGIYKVQEWHTNLGSKVTVYINPKIHKGYVDSCTECPLCSSDTLLPATKEEYLNNKQQ